MDVDGVCMSGGRGLKHEQKHWKPLTSYGPEIRFVLRAPVGLVPPLLVTQNFVHYILTKLKLVFDMNDSSRLEMGG